MAVRCPSAARLGPPLGHTGSGLGNSDHRPSRSTAQPAVLAGTVPPGGAVVLRPRGRQWEGSEFAVRRRHRKSAPVQHRRGRSPLPSAPPAGSWGSAPQGRQPCRGRIRVSLRLAWFNPQPRNARDTGISDEKGLKWGGPRSPRPPPQSGEPAGRLLPTALPPAPASCPRPGVRATQVENSSAGLCQARGWRC